MRDYFINSIWIIKLLLYGKTIVGVNGKFILTGFSERKVEKFCHKSKNLSQCVEQLRNLLHQLTTRECVLKCRKCNKFRSVKTPNMAMKYSNEQVIMYLLSIQREKNDTCLGISKFVLWISLKMVVASHTIHLINESLQKSLGTFSAWASLSYFPRLHSIYRYFFILDKNKYICDDVAFNLL